MAIQGVAAARSMLVPAVCSGTKEDYVLSFGDVEARVARVIEAARYSFSEAIDYLGCLAVLEAGNNEAVDSAIGQAGAGLAARTIHMALFQRVWMEVMTCFDPVRAGDYHMRVAMILLEDDDVLDHFGRHGVATRINDARVQFAALDVDDRLKKLRHYRNKEVAHLSDLDPSVPRPQIGELIEITRAVGSVAEALAQGAGIVRLALESQIKPFESSADAFWRPWAV